MPSPPRVVIKPRRARPFFARHPWVFANSIESVEGAPEPGDEVAVVSHEGKFIARGLFNPRSAIRVRLYRWEDAPIDDAYLAGLIDDALRLRTDILKLEGPGTAARLVFSESDGLSGLIVDRFDRHLVVQFTSLALHARRDFLLARLVERTGAESVTLRGEKGIPSQEGLKIEDGVAFGTAPDGPIEIVENGVTYAVGLGTGQKTGFYLDQRDNRRAASAHAAGKNVLDLFCYTGGFSLHALLQGGAASTLGFDSSSNAIELARANAVRNHAGSARFEVADVFDALETLKTSEQTFGLVICDPPKFARHARDVEDAVRGYLRLNRAAIHAVEPGGIFVTCSCSGLVGRDLFLDMLGQVAELSGRRIQILEQRGPAADHPVSASCLESDYLKCVIARVL
ncbi:class I SAM-dependent rRNA methyltransferase [Tundrisphaera sp. TA3]|uniref:class I SAM-dependent rRNA methyltransferase n=1 Tax=Tundrisphaera sp. TA3 TaxID=3435775 RepID=UPI003EBBA746